MKSFLNQTETDNYIEFVVLRTSTFLWYLLSCLSVNILDIVRFDWGRLLAFVFTLWHMSLYPDFEIILIPVYISFSSLYGWLMDTIEQERKCSCSPSSSSFFSSIIIFDLFVFLLLVDRWLASMYEVEKESE